MDEVDREHSVWEVQKADVMRLLGEEDRPERPDYLWDYHYSRDTSMAPVCAYIEHLEQAQTDALSVLENMEEGEAENPKEPNIKIWGNIHGYIWIGRGVHLWHRGNRIGYKPDDWEGEWPFEDTIGGTMTIEAEEPPAEDVGCPLSDAMGGTEEHARLVPMPIGQQRVEDQKCDGCGHTRNWHSDGPCVATSECGCGEFKEHKPAEEPEKEGE